MFLLVRGSADASVAKQTSHVYSQKRKIRAVGCHLGVMPLKKVFVEKEYADFSVYKRKVANKSFADRCKYAIGAEGKRGKRLRKRQQ